MNIVKFLIAPILKNICVRLLLFVILKKSPEEHHPNFHGPFHFIRPSKDLPFLKIQDEIQQPIYAVKPSLQLGTRE